MSLKYIVFFILIIISVIVNFGMPTEVIDKIKMISAVGYDYVDENTIQGTIITPTFMQQSEITDVHFTNTASMLYGLGTKLNTQTSEKLESGKIEVVLFNDELAKQGLGDYIDYLLREPSIGTRLLLAVVEGSTKDLLTTIKTKKGAGIYLSDLLEHNIQRQNHPPTNLKVFSSALKCNLCDPILPLIKMVDGKPKLDGIALFKNDKYIDRIPIDTSFPFTVLMNEMENGVYILKTDKYQAAIQNIDSNRKIIINQKGNNLTMEMNIKIEGIIREFTGKNISQAQKKIKKDMEKEIKKKAEEMVKHFQQKNIDPLGFKEIIRSRVRGLSDEQVKDIYPDMTIKTTVTYKNIETGTRR